MEQAENPGPLAGGTGAIRQCESITIIVPGEIVGKARPRFGAGGKIYSDARTIAFESRVRAAAWEAMRGRRPIAVPCRATVEIFTVVPASWSTARRELAMGRPAPGRPDIDNQLKALLDGCNRVAFVDDGLVAEIIASRRYDMAPGAIITIEALGDGRS